MVHTTYGRLLRHTGTHPNRVDKSYYEAFTLVELKILAFNTLKN